MSIGDRSVLFDTETTGFAPLNGDNDLPTGRRFHALIEPERDIPSEVSRVHGITSDDVVGKPLFAEVAQQLADFFGDNNLIAHNAPFDFGFLDMEFARLDRAPLCRDRMIDTLALAKARFPGCRTASTPSVSGFPSTDRRAPPTMPCSTASCLRRSTSN